ncbi:MAG: hypothetical protein ACRD1W_04150 [Vicinamibacterales bacterium]
MMPRKAAHHRARTCRAFASAAIFLTLASAFAQYDPAIQFQNRGDRYEGIRTIPVGGFDLELLSARIDQAPQPNPSWGENVALRFYLPEKQEVFITVRQLRSRSTYYWLDRVQAAWQPAAMNEYSWSTGPVLRRLPDVRLEDLGTTVRVGRDDPLARTQRVLPAVVFTQHQASLVRAYRFALKTNGRARVTAVVYAGNEELYRRPDNWEQAGSPFTIVWHAGRAKEAWYRLVLTGYFDNNTPLDKEILFYHRPSLFGADAGG